MTPEDAATVRLTDDERMSVLAHVPAAGADDETVAAVERILAERLAAHDDGVRARVEAVAES